MILGEPFESREKNKHTQAVTENKEKILGKVLKSEKTR